MQWGKYFKKSFFGNNVSLHKAITIQNYILTTFIFAKLQWAVEGKFVQPVNRSYQLHMVVYQVLRVVGFYYLLGTAENKILYLFNHSFPSYEDISCLHHSPFYSHNSPER